ncbi:MAG: HAD family phosphatase, partial [Anaerolineae bacterium]|nr:HAD family phosphatase [Anaerolineae bacterium]
MVYYAVLFDMDGVLIDTHEPVTRFWQEMAGRYGVTISEADFTRHVYGCPSEHTLAVLFSHLSAAECQGILDYADEFEARVTYTPLPGVLDLLRGLQAHGIPTALVTSGNRQKVRSVARDLPLDGLFTEQVTKEDVPHGKPDPAGYREAAQRLSVSPEQCIVFEDSVAGVRAAVAAGAFCVGVRPADTATALHEVGARHAITDFSAVRLNGE